MAQAAMARLPRIDIPGVPQHVIVRGVDRQPCFFNETDCLDYLACLREVAAERGVAVHAFVLMTNHVHLLATGSIPRSISAMMQGIGRRYVRRVNRLYGRTGTLFEGRFRASLVQSERYLLTCMRYIELNPVRASMVGDPAAYRWSSFRGNAGIEPMGWLQPHEEYLRLGSDSRLRAAAYQDLFNAAIGSEELATIRLHVNKDCVLGGERFQTAIAATIGRRVHIIRSGRPARAASIA
jgi:putative transposase